ncbi:MAG TPA: Zn-dependent hydrolase [Saprospirales bacterium]|nr:Zn-dependent hydrolase [Saprospirales bacterium]HAY71340.1 Zn-dependent hydrolase [Saprospirales bacterium]HRQ30961.1 hypothetical protein [Saprospiraceae bacterium]
MKLSAYLFVAGLIFISCKEKKQTETTDIPVIKTQAELIADQYAAFRLTTDVSRLSEKEKQMIRLMIDAADIMDELFWFQTYGNKDSLLSSLPDERMKPAVILQYGPWDRLDGNKAFIENVGEKPLGANYYPVDMTKDEFEMAQFKDKTDLYTFVRRDASGKLITVPYHKMFEKELKKAADLLIQASELAEDPGLKTYLVLRAEALTSDNYRLSDLAWMDMKNNVVDLVIGPIEHYDDQLYNYKAAYEAYVLVKDVEWSAKLERYRKFLPELQKSLPVDPKYKREKPGLGGDLNAYDAVYYTGDCNAGSKTIAINLPNDEEVQAKKGSRRLQLKNAMRAKFDKIMVPIADVLIDDEQKHLINFEAFFGNTMFHEVAHGLGMNNTINGKGLVRTALNEHASAIEESKADILGLYLVKQLHSKGELQGDLHGYYVTFMAGIFRSIRFGSSSAHGVANMIRFNYFNEAGAFTRDPKSGKYTIHFEKFEKAVTGLTRLILTLQGNGDYTGAGKLIEEKAKTSEELQLDLERLKAFNIPIDIRFEQGIKVLGL